MATTITALLISIVSVSLIYWSWREQGRWLHAFAGWVLAPVSIFAWSAASGPEFGVTYAVIAFACAAWLLAGSELDVSAGEDRFSVRTMQRLSCPSARSVLKNVAVFVLSVPATGLLSLMLSVVLVVNLPWSLLSRIGTAIILYPILWGVLSAWICSQEKLAKPATIVGGVFLISSLILVI